ncbi:ATP-binding protein [Streptomyces sp. KLOTTS4A1]|uniref:ATP-binding protein n=1 Tax=Streptomyces sp. KLOTTS4A1 TaxID=3390996 RepID=UPI0039F4C002
MPNPTPPIKECTWQLPRSPRTPARARALLRHQLTEWKVDDDLSHTATLLLSELVTNSVRHARGAPGREVGLRLVTYEGRLRVEVADASSGWPAPRTADEDEEEGRGLALVVALADRWGCCPRRHGIGKAVWAELSLASA